MNNRARTRWSKMERGLVELQSARCGCCQRVESFGTRMISHHMARSWLRTQGWVCLPEWGWTCTLCIQRVPALLERAQRIRDAQDRENRRRAEKRRQKKREYMRGYRERVRARPSSELTAIQDQLERILKRAQPQKDP